MIAQNPAQLSRYVDKDGRLTIEGMIYFTHLVEVIRALEDRIVALEAFHP